MIITNSGIIIRLSVEQISSTGRVAQGVKLINLKDEQKVSSVATIKKEVQNIENKNMTYYDWEINDAGKKD